MHDTYAHQGFAVLGFPCNQFGAQEPGTDAEIHAFATSAYGVTFPMFHKIEVNGDGACELYRWLRAETGGGDITWNFEKFLIGRDGQVIERFNPMVTPEQLEPNVVAALGG